MGTRPSFPFQIVLFDFEGTLVYLDSRNAVEEARQAVLRTRLLRDLHGRRVRTGLVTNIGAKASTALAGLELAEYINAVVTGNDVELLKPSGEGIRTALRKLGGDKSAALFVGDSITDILAAREAGVPVAIVQGGESDPDSLAGASAIFQLWSIRDLCSRVGR